MRMLTLCSYCAGKEEVTYADLMAPLRVQKDDVEDWVVKSIAEGLMEAKLDQLREVVLIRYTKSPPRISGSGAH
jgi:translation initiation factor 3 subunit M